MEKTNTAGDHIKIFAARLVSFSMGPVIAGLIGIVIVPITTYFVSPYEFGKASMYTLAYTLSSIVIYLGLDQSFLREYHANEHKKSVFASAVFLPLIFSVLALLILLICYKQISLLLFEEINIIPIVFLAFSIVLSIFQRFSLLLLRIRDEAKSYTLYIVLNKFFEASLIIIILPFLDNSFIGVVQASFYSLLIVTLLLFIKTIKFWKSLLYIDKKLTRKMLAFGLPLLPATVIIWVFNSIDRLSLKYWSTYEEIGIYTAAFKIVAILAIFQQAFATFWIPTAYKWYESKIPVERFEKVAHVLTFFMGILFIFVIVFKDHIVMILGDSYSLAALCVPFLLFSPLMYTVSECTSLGIAFKRKTHYNIFISVTVALMNLIGNYLLVPIYGALGASISTGLSYIAFFWLRTLISRKLWYRFSIKVYVLNTILMLLVAITSLIYDSVILIFVFIIILCFVNINALKYSVQIFEIFMRKKDE